MRNILILCCLVLTVGCSNILTNDEFESKYGKIIRTEPCIVQVVTDRNLIVQYIITKDNKKQIIWSGKIKQ